MRRVTAILSVAAVTLMAAGLVAQAKPSFAGEWKLVAEQGLGQPGVDLTITQSATAMTLEYRGGTKLTCTLDGSVNKNMTAGRGGAAPTEHVSRAMWDGNTLVVTTTTGAGEEKRTFTTDGAYLVIETSAPAQNGGAPTKVAYKRYQRGFGG
jgi:hypothetical protein